MDTLEQDICAGIDRFIKLQIPFAIYRIPGENVVISCRKILETLASCY